MNIVDLLGQEIVTIDESISTLENRKSLIMGVIQNYNGIHPVHTNGTHKAEAPKKEVTEKRKYTKKSSGEKESFSKALKKVFEANPNNKFNLDELTTFMQKQIAKGHTEEPAKPVRDYIGVCLFNFAKQGFIEKILDDGKKLYILSSSEGDQSTLLEDKVLTILESAPSTIFQVSAICSKIKLSTDYNEIAKDLSGSLDHEVTQVLISLQSRGKVIREGSDEWSFNRLK